ncbi:MAG TPA: hypothetical protein VHJ76_03000 [Actinomycetota bacterium]|nr:hypothetical protein [Actinomycetota bacterium]
MRRKLAVVFALATALTVTPLGLTGTASACPDPDNPCDIKPWDPIDPVQLCKFDPRC